MKNLYKITGVVILLALINNVPSFGQPHFYGILKEKGKTKEDSLWISYNPSSLFGSYDRFYFVVKVDKDGKFNFKLPNVSKPFLMQISTFWTIPGRIGNNQYYVEKNDSIKLEINKNVNRDTLSFSGRGAEKYNLIEKLRTQQETFDAIAHNKIKLFYSYVGNADTLKLKLVHFSALVEQYSKMKTNLIKGINNVEMIDLLQYQFTNYYNLWNTKIKQLFDEFSNHPIHQKIIAEHFKAYKDQFIYKPNSIMSLAPNYVSFLLRRHKQDLQFDNLDKKVGVITYYDYLKNGYTTELRERLLFEFFLSKKTVHELAKIDSQTYDSLLNNALKLVTRSNIKQILLEQTRTNKGNKLFESGFLDMNGKNISTKSLLGKVFLIDVWFLGCTGCAAFHDRFEKEVYPKFKGNKNFVLLSINVNKMKEKWLEGIRSNNYTSKEYLNVYTNGLAFEHQFIKYYGIDLTGAPYLLLVDKNGNIYTKPTIGISSEDLIAYITEALNEKNESK